MSNWTCGFESRHPHQKERQERFYLSCLSFWVPPPLAAPPYLFYLLGRNKSVRHQDFCYAKMLDTPHSRRIFSPTSGLTLLAKKKDRKDKIFPVLLFGGGEGSRTPVRKRFNGNFSGRRRLFTFPYPGVGRHTQGLGSFIVHGALKALRTHVHH